MDPLFVAKLILKACILPPGGPLLVALAGIAIIRRRPRLGRALAAAGVASLLALSTPLVAGALIGLLNLPPVLDVAQAKEAQAIVILGGGTRRHAAEYDGDTLGRLTLERVRYGARVARLTALPVLVSGGAPLGGATEAALMQRALEDEFAVAVRWADGLSRNTRENAQHSAALLKAAGIRKVVLVAHSFDMQRAIAEFAEAGIGVIAAPTALPNLAIAWPLDLIPSVAGLEASYYGSYELLANAIRAP